VKAVPSLLKRAKPRMNTGLDATGRRLEDRFSSRAIFWDVWALICQAKRLTEKIQGAYTRITCSGEYLRRNFPDTGERWHKLHDRP